MTGASAADFQWTMDAQKGEYHDYDEEGVRRVLNFPDGDGAKRPARPCPSPPIKPNKAGQQLTNSTGGQAHSDESGNAQQNLVSTPTDGAPCTPDNSTTSSMRGGGAPKSMSALADQIMGSSSHSTAASKPAPGSTAGSHSTTTQAGPQLGQLVGPSQDAMGPTLELLLLLIPS